MGAATADSLGKTERNVEYIAGFSSRGPPITSYPCFLLSVCLHTLGSRHKILFPHLFFKNHINQVRDRNMPFLIDGNCEV